MKSPYGNPLQSLESLKFGATKAARVLLLGVFLLSSIFKKNALGADGTWSATSGTWDTSATNWTGVSGTPWDSTNGTSNTANFTATSGSATVSGTVFVNGISYTAASGSFAINSGTITLAGAAPSITVNPSRTLTINSTLAGSAGLTKNGTGTLDLTGANTFTGAAIVNAGILNLTGSAYNNTAANSSAFTIAAGATLNANFSGSVYSSIGSVAGSGTLQIGTSGQFNRFNTGYDNTNTTFSGAVSMANSSSIIYKRGTGTWTLSGNNTSTWTAGILDVRGGETVLANAGAAGNASVQFGGASTLSASVSGVQIRGGLDFSSFAGNLGSATNTNDILVSGAVNLGTTTRTITVSNNTTFSGNVTNTAGLSKAGTGTLILSGNNTYTGNTSVTAGVVRASHANALGTTGNGTIVSNNAALELTGGISIGAEALSVTGSGISSTGALRNISGANSYGGVITLAGATTIGSDAGTLTLSSGSSITGSNTNLTFVGAGNITINDAIATGTGTLTKNGTGTLTLAGSNTYTGTTTINAGVLRLNSATALPGGIEATGGTSNLYIDGGVLGLGAGDFTRARGTTSANVRIFNGGFAAYGADRSVNFNNEGSSVSWGSGDFLYVNSGNTNGLFILGAADADKTLTFVNPINFGSQIRTVQVNDGTASVDAILSGALSGASGGLTKTGNGTLALTATNSYTGATTINVGTLQIGNGGATGNLSSSSAITNNGTLVFNRTGNITQGTDFSNNISGTGNLTQAGSGNLTISSSNTYTGATTVSAGTLTLSGGLSNSSVTVNGGAFNQTAAGTIAGSSATFTLSSGSATLAGNNTYSGGTTLSAGTLQIGHANALGTSGTITLGGGTLQYGSGITTDLSSRFSTAANQAYNIDTNPNNVTYASALTSSGGTLTKNGSGMLTLSNAGNTFGGATTVNAGTLSVTGSSTASTTTVNSGATLIGTGSLGSVTVNSGGFIGAGNAAATPGTLTLGSLTLNGGGTYTWDFGNTSGTAGTNWDLLSVTNALTINATSGSKFTVAITGTPTGWAPSSTQTWNIINYGSLANAWDASVFNLSSSLSGTGTWAFTNNSTSKFIGLTYTVISSTSTWSGASGNWSTGFSSTPTTGSPIVFDGAAGGTATNNIASGNLTSLTTITINSTAGSYTLAAVAGASGVDASTPMTLTSGITNNSANATTVNLALAVAASPVSINAAAGNINLGGPVSNSNTITFSGANSTTVSGAISGAGAITQNGTGTLTLSATNTYTGDTTIGAGSLQITGSGSLGTGASYSGNISNSGTFSLNTTTDQTLAGILSGNGALVKSNTNTVILSGANTFTGNTTINAGTLRVNGTGTLGNATYAGTIANNGTLFFNTSTNQTLSGAISGSGALTQNGTSALTLNGSASSYTGATTVNSGTLIVVNNAYSNTTTSSSAITIASGATLNASQTGVFTYSNFGALNGAGTLIIGTAAQLNRFSIGYDNASSTFSGLISMVKSDSVLNKYGTGTLTLSGNNSISNGSLNMRAGELVFANAAAPGSMKVDFASGGTISASVTGVDIKGGMSFSGANGNLGSSTNTSDLLVSGAVDLGTTTRTITVSNNTTFSGNVTNTAGLTKAGTGTLILSGNNTYAGTTTVSTGVLRASHANALGTTGNGTTVSSGAALELSGGISIGAETLSLTGNGISSTGALRNISGNNAYAGAISLAGATTIGSDAGNLTLSSGSSITGTNTNLTIVGAGNITINDAIATGTGTLTKNGTGTLTLGGSNSYTGATTLNTGNISFSTTAALVNSSSLSMANATSLIYTGGSGSLDRAITITSGTGTIRNSGTGLLTLSGALTKNSTTLTLQGGANGITVSGVISGSSANSDLVIDGGTTTLTNANNTYNGPTFIINSGTLNANTAGALPTSTLSAVTINGSSTLALGASQSVASLSGTSGSSVNLNANTLTINGSATTTYSGGISGTGNLVKNGSGTQTLAGATTFNGTTTVNSGTLQASTANALANTSQVVLNNGGSFLVTAENTVNDDAAIHLNGGRMAMSGNFNETVGALTLSANSTLDFSGFVGTLRFGSIASWAAGANLAIWNWSGRTEYGTNYGTYPNSSNLVFTNNSTLSSNLANISFYSDSGTTSIGSGFERGFSGGGTEIIAVPETETYFYAVALLAGVVVQYLRRRAKLREGHRPAWPKL
jgi:autotransporter-associated beta strand protein